jgi:hypothetical protein
MFGPTGNYEDWWLGTAYDINESCRRSREDGCEHVPLPEWLHNRNEWEESQRSRDHDMHERMLQETTQRRDRGSGVVGLDAQQLAAFLEVRGQLTKRGARYRALEAVVVHAGGR